MKKVTVIWFSIVSLALAGCRGEHTDPAGGAGSEAVVAPETIDCGGTIVPVGPMCGGMWLAIVGCCADTFVSSSVAEALICSMYADEAICAQNPAAVDAQCNVLGRMTECQGSAGAGGEPGAGAGAGAGEGGASGDGSAGASGAAGGAGSADGGQGGAVVAGEGGGGAAGPPVLPPVDPAEGAAECEAVCGPCHAGFRAPNNSVCCESRPCYCNGIDTWYSTVDCSDQRMRCVHRDEATQTLAYCAAR